MHFLENPNNYKFVNHINGDKSNNTITNLEWCTQSHNEKHAFATGLKRKTNKRFKVVLVDGREQEYENQYIFAEEFNVCQQTVSLWLNNKKKPSEKHGIKYIFFI